jgi:hypothetical protein
VVKHNSRTNGIFRMCKGPYGKASNLVYILGFDNDSEELMHWNTDPLGVIELGI